MSDLAKKYQAIKKIVDERQHGKVDGMGVDAFTAGMLVQICEKLNPTTRAKFLSLPIHKMVDVGWKLSNSAWKSSVPRYEREIRGSMKTAGRMKEIAMLKDDLARLSDDFDYLLENDPDNRGLQDMQDQIEEMRDQLQAYLPKLKVGKKLSLTAIPKDYPVQPLKAGQVVKGMATCGNCGLSWDDDKSTSMTPTPSGRCPFERFHK